MPSATARLGLTAPLTTDADTQIRLSIAGNATTLDAAAMYQSGTFAARPASPVAGTFYYATDTAALYVYGTAWQLVATNGGAVPVGTIQQFAAASVQADPDGVTRWNVCDGSAISRTTHASLFSLVGTTYGAGDGTTTFNIPDMRGRIAVGADSGGVHLPTNHPALGASGGEERHTLSTGEMPSHSHTTDYDGQFIWTTGSGAFNVPFGSGNTVSPTNTFAVNAAGGGTSHNNLQPYLAVNHIIKVL